jgi:hypothetical protein
VGESWEARLAREVHRYADGEGRLPGVSHPDERQRQLTRMGNAAGGAGLALIMEGRADESRAWFTRAAVRYRESFADAPAGSWGRPIGAIKARLLAGDQQGAEDDARWTIGEGAGISDSPIGRYAACLANLALGADDEALELAQTLEQDQDFPRDVACSLIAISLADGPSYEGAILGVLRSFETRDDYLEDVPVADTVLVLQVLAGRRRIAVRLESPLVPPAPGS